MAKGIYLGIESISRKVKKMFVGVEGVARKVKKGYVGVNGLARLFFSGKGNLSYYGQLADVPSYLVINQEKNGVRFGDNGVTVGINKVFAYSSDLALSEYNGGHANASFTTTPNHLFVFYSLNQKEEFLSVFTKDFTVISDELIQENQASRARVSTASCGNYAIFAGGHAGLTGYASFKADAWDDDMVKVDSIQQLPSARYQMASCNFDDVALFFGGAESSPNTQIDEVLSYNSDLTLTIWTPLSEAKALAGSCCQDDYALVGGGQALVNYNPTLYTSVDAYTKEGVRITAPELQIDKREVCAVGVEGYAIFAGGAGYWAHDSVDSYDEELSHMVQDPLSEAKYQIAAIPVANYGIFAGGWNSGYRYKVDCFVVN